MFWRRDKPLRVELLTPIHVTASSAPAHHKTLDDPAAKEMKTNTELAFKLITFGALASQAALLIYGLQILKGIPS